MLRQILMLSICSLFLTVAVTGCGGSNPTVIDPDQLSAEEKAKQEQASIDYDAYMNDPTQ